MLTSIKQKQIYSTQSIYVCIVCVCTLRNKNLNVKKFQTSIGQISIVLIGKKIHYLIPKDVWGEPENKKNKIKECLKKKK